MPISGTIRYFPVIGKTLESRSYSDGTSPRVLNTEAWFSGLGETHFALGGPNGSYSLGSPGTTPEIVSGLGADSRVSLHGLKLRWIRSEGTHSTIVPNMCQLMVYVGKASSYSISDQSIWYLTDPIVTTSGQMVEHVFGDLESISVPAGSNIFVYVYTYIDVGAGSNSAVVVGEMNCEMVIDD